MAKPAENARQAFASKLEVGEELRSVGELSANPSFQDKLTDSKNFYFAGITNKRLLIVRLNWLSKPIDKENYSIPLPDVKLEESGTLGAVLNQLLVKLPDKEKPVRFWFEFGMQKLTGFDVDEFKSALGGK